MAHEIRRVANMILILIERHALSFSGLEQFGLADVGVMRVLLACALGGVIGIDREYRHKASGVRTNLLICFGAALFTYLSPLIAGDLSTNKGQIASNVVQGVGFLGAGLILHNRNRVLGLTSAATVFAVAAVGMACGAGLYLTATFATVLVIFVLEAVGAIEVLTNLKLQNRSYEIRGSMPDVMYGGLLATMDEENRRLEQVERETVGAITRMIFNVLATRKGHQHLIERLREAPGVERVLTFRNWEED